MYAQLSNQNLQIHFLDAVVQIMIFLKESFNSSKYLLGLFFINGTLQPLYMVIHSHLDGHQSQIIRPLSIILRPELTILEISQIQPQYYYLIPLGLVCFKNIFLIIIVCLFMKKIRNLQQMEGQFSVQIMVQIISFYQQFMQTILVIPLTSMCLQSITDIFQDFELHDNGKYMHIFLGLITLCLIQFDAIIFLLVTEKSISYKIIGLERIYISLTDYFIFFLKMVQIFIFIAFPGASVADHVQHYILFILSIMSLRNQLKNRSYILNYQVQIYFLCNSLILICSIASYISLIMENYDYFLTISFLMYPLVYSLLLNLQERDQIMSYQYLFKPQDNFIHEIIYQLIRILNNCDNSVEKTVFRIQMIYHVCMKMPNQTQLDGYNISEPFQSNPITKAMEKSFIFQLLQIIKKNYKSYKVKSFSQKQYLLYSYLILLYSFGWYQLSVKNLSFLIYRNGKNSNKKDDFLYQMTSHNSSYEQQDKQLILIEENDYAQIKLTIYQRNKFIYLLKKSKLHMKNKFGSSLQAAQQNQMSTYINYYLLNEFKLNQSYYNIIDQIDAKIQFYTQLMYKFDYGLIQQLAKKINILDADLRRYYQECPSIRFQRMLCFYQAEVLNNYYIAYRYQKSLADDHLFGFDSIDELGYAFISVNEDLNNLNIEQYSVKFAEIYGLKDNIIKLRFGDILPKLFVQEHNLFIEGFLSSGKSQYYRSFNSNYMRQTNGLIKSLNTCFDNTQLISQDKLLFVALIQENRNLVNFFLVDCYYKTGGFTAGFLEKLGYEEQFIKNLCSIYQFDDIQIDLILPNFEALVSEGYVEKKIVNEDMYFPNLFKIITNKNLIRNTSRLIQEEEFKSEQNLNYYQCDLTIKIRIINRFIYYLIEFENIYKAIPQNDDMDSQNFVVNIKSEELEPQEIHVFDVKSRQKYDFDENKGENQSNQISFIDKIGSEHQNLTGRNGSKLLLNNSSEMLNSNGKLSKTTKKQQEFYNQNVEEIKSQFQLLEIDNLINIHNKANRSAYSSSSLRASELFNKSLLIQRVLAYKVPDNLFQILVFLFFYNIVIFSFILIVLTNLDHDYSKFVDEIQSISLHANVMGPQDLFFSMKITITAYQQLYEEGYISEEMQDSLIEPYFEHMPVGYKELKQNLYNSLENPFIKSFLNDITLQVHYQYQNNSQLQNFNMTFREEILQMASYQYTYLQIYNNRQSSYGTPAQTFVYANYFDQHQILESLTNDLLNYSKSRGELVNDKWMTICVIYIVMQFIFGVFVYFQFNTFYGKFDKFMLLYNFVNLHTLIIECERYKKLIKEIQDDHLYIYRYYFDTDRKEFQQDMEKIQQLKGKGRQRILFKKYSRLPTILFMSMIFTIFFVFSFTINQATHTFLTKYQATTDLYKLIQDMKLRSGTIVMYKELFYRWNAFPFWTDEDRIKLYHLIDLSQNAIDDYVSLTATLDPSLYLIDQNFIDFFEIIQKDNLCLYIEYDFFDFMEKYCDIALEGTLKKGIVASLNYLQYSIKTEQALNNFTERTSINLYEYEGSQVITRVFFNLSNNLESGFTSMTSNQNTLIQQISETYLVLIIFFTLLAIILLRFYLIGEYQIIKRIVSLIPAQIILEEAGFERYLKQVALNQKLM